MATRTNDVFQSASKAGIAANWIRAGFAGGVLFTCLTAQAAETALLLPSTVITFDNQTGAYGTVYAGHTEGAFTVTPTVGVWYESMQYGNPVPSIYTGPPGTPQRSVLQITSFAGLFSFGSLDFSSNNGISTYSIQGYLGPALKFDQIGILQNLASGFDKLWSHSMEPIDGLLIDVTPGVGTTSVNLDNISLTLVQVPEPGALSLLAMALGAWLFSRLRG